VEPKALNADPFTFWLSLLKYQRRN